jgi:hypothetical protein
MPHDIPWQSLDGQTKLADGDQILLQSLNGPVNDFGFTIVLALAQNVDWWKQVQIVDGQGKEVSDQAAPGNPIYTDNWQKPVSMTLYQVQPDWTIILWKAKFLGGHSDMYRLVPPMKEVLKFGMTHQFNWLNQG